MRKGKKNPSKKTIKLHADEKRFQDIKSQLSSGKKLRKGDQRFFNNHKDDRGYVKCSSKFRGRVVYSPNNIADDFFKPLIIGSTKRLDESNEGVKKRPYTFDFCVSESGDVQFSNTDNNVKAAVAAQEQNQGDTNVEIALDNLDMFPALS